MSSISSFTNCGGVDDGHNVDDDDHDDILDAGNKGKIVDLVMNTMVISTCTDGRIDGEHDGGDYGVHIDEQDGGHYVEHKGGEDGGHDDVHDGGSHLHRVDLVLDGYHVTFHFTHISLARFNTGENNGCTKKLFLFILGGEVSFSGLKVTFASAHEVAHVFLELSLFQS